MPAKSVPSPTHAAMQEIIETPAHGARPTGHAGPFSC